MATQVQQDMLALLKDIRDHVRGSHHCEHDGRDETTFFPSEPKEWRFTYDFCFVTRGRDPIHGLDLDQVIAAAEQEMA